MLCYKTTNIYRVEIIQVKIHLTLLLNYYLTPQNIWVSMGLDEIISPPFDGFQSMLILSSILHFSAVFNHTPRQHCYGKCHWQTKFHIVTSIVVPSHQVHLKIHMKAKQNGTALNTKSTFMVGVGTVRFGKLKICNGKMD